MYNVCTYFKNKSIVYNVVTERINENKIFPINNPNVKLPQSSLTLSVSFRDNTKVLNRHSITYLSNQQEIKGNLW